MTPSAHSEGVFVFTLEAIEKHRNPKMFRKCFGKIGHVDK